MGDVIPHRQTQLETPIVVAVAGPAGSGKTTLGRALATALGLPILDLDQLTNPLLDRLYGADSQAHWLTGADANVVRDGRYAALRATARDVVSVGVGVVLVAPFTAELSGGEAWAALLAEVKPAQVTVVYLSGSPDLLQARIKQRGEPRDEFHQRGSAYQPPGVAYIALDAAWTTYQQMSRVLRELGHRSTLDLDNSVFDLDFDAVLFDLDGTLVDSTPAILRTWGRLAEEFGFDPTAVQNNHGMTALNLLGEVLDPHQVMPAYQRITDLEATDTAGVMALPGAAELLESLPARSKGIVTSGRQVVAVAKLAAAELPLVEVMVTADDVVRGKPDPEPYLLAADRLGVMPGRCLVVEDAAAGVTAGRRAGCVVLGVGGTCQPKDLGADMWVDHLDQVRFVARRTGYGLTPRSK